jgi:hypothetical protein
MRNRLLIEAKSQQKKNFEKLAGKFAEQRIKYDLFNRKDASIREKFSVRLQNKTSCDGEK